MKKAIIFLSALFLFCISFTASAQEDMNLEDRLELKLEFFLEQMELEEEQRAQFTEMYRENAYRNMEKRRMDMEKGDTDGDSRTLQSEKMESLSEEEAHEIFIQKLEQQEVEFRAKKDYQLKLLKTIGAKNMLKLQLLEEQFQNKMKRDSGEKMRDSGEE